MATETKSWERLLWDDIAMGAKFLGNLFGFAACMGACIYNITGSTKVKDLMKNDGLDFLKRK